MTSIYYFPWINGKLLAYGSKMNMYHIICHIIRKLRISGISNTTFLFTNTGNSCRWKKLCKHL